MKGFRLPTFFIALVFLFVGRDCTAQQNDSLIIKTDSLEIKDSIKPITSRNIIHAINIDSLLKKNKFLNLTATPVSLAAKLKTRPGKEFLFYLLAIVILLLAIFKFIYTKYFNNIFRVFFNSSLRQNQLTDLLLQAKLPSLLFNIFFIISAGLYAWLLLEHYHQLKESNNYVLIGLSILFVGIIYSGKFLTLKLIGLISGMQDAADQYIFVIFLINKIIGILLIPFIVLVAFSPSGWINPIMIFSYCVIGILFLLRYLRSYGLLQTQVKITGIHFLLYIIGMEILPLLLIYKLLSEY
ncbi:MAG: DUF4271 domain-containing protein [Ginsengibacter sp.]